MSHKILLINASFQNLTKLLRRADGQCFSICCREKEALGKGMKGGRCKHAILPFFLYLEHFWNEIEIFVSEL
jgi:hypothetical protein